MLPLSLRDIPLEGWDLLASLFEGGVGESDEGSLCGELAPEKMSFPAASGGVSHRLPPALRSHLPQRGRQRLVPLFEGDVTK